MGNKFSSSLFAESRARASAIRLKSSTDAFETYARISATRVKSRTDASEARARASAIHEKSRTDVSEARARLTTLQLKNGVLIVLCVATSVTIVFLAADFVVHDLPWFQRYSIRSKLLARETPPSARLLSDDDRLVSTQPLPLPGFRPTAVLGAPGCRKSTFVSDIALAELKLPRSAPVILLRLRISAAADGTSRDAPQPMQGTDELSLQICAQLGFPGRPSFLRGLLCHGVEISGNRFQLGRIPSSAERVVAALAMFFDECEKIKMEGVARGQTPLESAPLLVFDEVQGLVQNANLKNAGGQVIFDALGQGIVAYGPERCAVRVVMTGSSADVYALIEAASPRNERFVRFDLEDPTEDVMASALVRRGYSEQESRAMIAQCGTRLRLFDEPLRLGASLLSAEKFRRDADTGRPRKERAQA